MKEHYDFSKGVPNPYAKRLKKSITIDLDEKTIKLFQSEAGRIGEKHYESLISNFLINNASEETIRFSTTGQ